MAIFNYLIRHIEGLIGTPATIQNKQIKTDIGENGSGRDRSQLVYKDSAGVEHVFGTTEELKDYVDEQISINTNLSSSEGTYSPNVALTSNCTFVANTSFNWFRLGSYVTIYGLYTFNFSEGLNCFFDIDLPVSSNFTSTNDASGSVGDVNLSSASYISSIIAVAAGDYLRINFKPSSGGNSQLSIYCTYKVK